MNIHNLHALHKFRTTAEDLAMIRTELANERTFLAYIRTFIGTFASGVGLIKLTDEPTFVGTGFGLAIIAPIILAFGIARTIKTNLKLRVIESSMEASEASIEASEDSKDRES